MTFQGKTEDVGETEADLASEAEPWTSRERGVSVRTETDSGTALEPEDCAKEKRLEGSRLKRQAFLPVPETEALRGVAEASAFCREKGENFCA